MVLLDHRACRGKQSSNNCCARVLLPMQLLNTRPPVTVTLTLFRNLVAVDSVTQTVNFVVTALYGRSLYSHIHTGFQASLHNITSRVSSNLTVAVRFLQSVPGQLCPLSPTSLVPAQGNPLNQQQVKRRKSRSFHHQRNQFLKPRRPLQCETRSYCQRWSASDHD
jgi:hypothetical protein